MTPTAWATHADVTSGPCADLSDPAEQQALDDKLAIATYLLWLRTGRRWPGVQTDSVRPAGGSCGGCGRLSGGRGGHVSEIRLPGYPVLSIVEVWVDGVLVDPDEYRVDDNRWLVRFNPDPGDDRHDGWPCCQRMDRELTEDATFGVVYTWGGLPPAAGVAAAKRLGCELHLASDPDTASSCKLPIGVVRSITRQGVSIEIGQTIDLDSCGLPEVTMWLAAEDADRRGSHSGGRVIDPYRLSQRGRRVRRPGTGTQS